MPELQNPNHERFAQLRADGMRLEDAYEQAGFAPDRSHPSRLAAREEVLARVAELRAARPETVKSDPQAVIATLLEVARAGLAIGTPAGVKEARLALLDVHGLQDLHGKGRERDRAAIIYYKEKQQNQNVIKNVRT